MSAGLHRLRLLLFLAVGLAACQPDDASTDGVPCRTDNCAGSVASPVTAPAPAHSGHHARASFDYWVLALSWSPEFCASSEARPGSRQCSEPHEFIVHGLWPQYERGYPASCDNHARVDEETADRLAPLVPDRGLVFHQWKKHGSCSGLTPDAYFETLERAGRSVVVPSQALHEASQQPVKRVDLEHAFVEANPGLTPEAITFECKGSKLREVRICLDHGLKPRACGRDVNEGCGSKPFSVRAAQG